MARGHRNPQPPHEYNNSSAHFAGFLFQTPPFDQVFSEVGAKEFYSNVRCALLHEARTKDGWIIWGDGPISVDFKRKIVYRDVLQAELESYIEGYGVALTTDIALQQAFVRKFDDLAT